MGTPHIRRATEEDSGALATLVPGVVPSGTDEHHATFVIDGPAGPIAVLDLLQGERHLDLLHLRAPDLAHAQLLQGFAEAAARALHASEIRLAPGAMDEAQAAVLGYVGGAMRVRPAGVPLWRDGTAGFSQSLYYRGVWASLALLTGLGSVSLAVFSGGQLTLAHIFLPAILCVVGTLFAFWQILLILQASRRSSPWVFALSAAVALATVGLVGITVRDRAVPALSELWAIRAGDTALGDLEANVSPDSRMLYVAGAYGTHSEEVVRRALAENNGVREVVLEGPGGRASVGFALFQMFRERKLATRVETGCASACTIAFLGGVERTVSPSGRLGFHAASFPGMGEGDMHDANRGIRNFMVYSARLTPEFARKVIETPAESIWVPTHEELLAGKVITR
ncbi:MAG: hypothetical protein J0J01_21890 [Reyranella sp.]|uniref:hypothetical protein n=1 Tax=Reyranella sp. TaxID=1929291 RepID=UPI001AD0553C|nr:hypothetical protein [Reyranella sp.]MBN9089573.1 hypothetical protein [Reyranella sp.]